VYWFWFWTALSILMLLADVGWWVVVMGLTKRRLVRALVSVFLAGQMSAALVFMGELDVARHIPKAIVSAVLIWHYFASAALVLLLVSWGSIRLIRQATRALRGNPAPPATAPASARRRTRREFIGACAALAPPLFTIGLTAAAQAQLSSLRVRRFTLAVPLLPRVLDGITIAQVSDTHVGGLTTDRLLRKAVEVTNALRADLVVLTGDLINYELSDLSDAIALARRFESHYGLSIIEGNHDIAVDAGEFERRLKAAGLPLLLDESTVVEVRGYPVQLFGLRWMSSSLGDDRDRDRVLHSQVRDLMRHRQPDAFPILLAHHPHAFDAAVSANLPLTLAGHTHGGQWMLSSHLGVASVFFRYWSGRYARGRSQMIVSNGVGNWLPLRINAPAEIIHITLRAG
jgi:predicted MPP superfamily phosphohydrolase